MVVDWGALIVVERRGVADQRRVAELAKRVARLTLGIGIKIQIIDAPEATTRADSGSPERFSSG